MREPIKSNLVISYVRQLRRDKLSDEEIILKLIERATKQEYDWGKHCPVCNTRNIFREGGDYISELWKCNKHHQFKVKLITRREVVND